MDDLKSVLERHGISTATLRLFANVDVGPIYSLTVDGADAIEQWAALRALVEQTGCWPVLLGDDESVEEHLEILSYAQELPVQPVPREMTLWPPLRLAPESSPAYPDPPPPQWKQTTASIIEAGLNLDPAMWLHERLAMTRPDEEEDEVEWPPRGKWPDVRPATQFTIPFHYETGEPLPATHIALLPTTTGWHAPAILRYGGWNECPEPHEHVCMMKHWYERYGAEVVGMAFDTIEMQVARPPRSSDEALQLAFEQYAYCSDIVDQGADSLDHLAALLLGGTVWYFWWD